jgi:hypothetical protein
MTKWGHYHVETYESAGMTVNLIRRSHKWTGPFRSKQILSHIRSAFKSFFHAPKPDRFTIGHDYTYRRASESLTLTEYIYAFMFALIAIVIFVQCTWLMYDLDRAFRAWLQVVR